MRLPWLSLALVIFALAEPTPAALAGETVGSVDDARVVLTRFRDARIDRQDAVWISLLTIPLAFGVMLVASGWLLRRAHTSA